MDDTKANIDYVKYIPIIYPILVFFGYINYDFFYRRFDIDIFNYLSVNEFLFSFVSLAYPILITFVAYLGFNVYNSLMPGNILSEQDSKNSVVENKNEKIPLRPPKSIYRNKFDDAKKAFSSNRYWLCIGNFGLGILFSLLYVVAFILPIAILFFGWHLVISPLFYVTNLQSIDIERLGFIDTPAEVVGTALGWFLTFGFYLGVLHQNQKITQKKFRFLLIAASCCLLISSLIRYQNIKSHAFLYDDPEKYVCFQYENNNVESTEDIRFLGMTSEYIFLRDIENKTNFIYRLTNVRNLKTTTIRK